VRLADLHLSHLSSGGAGRLGRACKSSYPGCSARTVWLSIPTPSSRLNELSVANAGAAWTSYDLNIRRCAVSFSSNSVGASLATPLGGIRQHEQVQTGEQEQGEREHRQQAYPRGILPLYHGDAMLTMTATAKAMDSQRWVCRIHLFQFNVTFSEDEPEADRHAYKCYLIAWGVAVADGGPPLRGLHTAPPPSTRSRPSKKCCQPYFAPP
jgi:hypothetical protein